MTDPAPDATALANRRTGVNTLLLALPAYLLIAAAWPLVSPRLVTAGFANAQGAFSNTMLLFGCTVLAVIAAGALPDHRRRMLLAVSLAVGAFLLAAGPLLVPAGNGKPQTLAVMILLLIDAARGFAPALAAIIALDIFRGDGAAKPLAAVAAVAPLAVMAWGMVNFLSSKLNPDLTTLAPAGQLIALAGLVVAGLLVSQVAGTPSPAEDKAETGWAAALAELWRTPAVSLALMGRILSACAIGSLRVFSYELAQAKGSTIEDAFTRDAGLAAGLIVAGTLAGAALADARRGRDPGGDAMVGALALGLAAPVYLFGIFSNSPQQLSVSFGIAAGLCAAAWAPTFLIVQDPARPRVNPITVALLVWITTQMDVLGLTHLVQAMALKLGGAQAWSFDTGFWGTLQYSPITTRFFLPFKLKASLGAGDGVLQSSATLICLLLLGAAGLYFLSARALRGAAAPRPEGGGDSTGPVLVRMLTTFAIVLAVALGAAAVQAVGTFERQWSDKLVWKSPDTAWAAVRQCKTPDCLTDLMARNDASPEAIAFTTALYQRFTGDYVGYATAFRGDGRVKAVEYLLPNLSTAGYIGQMFVDGTRPLVNQYDQTALDRMAGTNDVFQRIHINYPKSTTWPEHVYVREDARSGGGQSFVMDLRIVNGCKTCDLLGSVEVAYDFDGRGHFEGAHLIEVKSAPAPTPSAPPPTPITPMPLGGQLTSPLGPGPAPGFIPSR